MKYNKKTKMYESKFWHPALTTDAVIFGFDNDDSSLQILLIKRGKAKDGEIGAYEGFWALPGGFIQENESTDDCVRRELLEEASMKLFVNDKGIDPEFLEQLKVYSGKDRDPREYVATVAYYALVKRKKYTIKGGDDAADAKWFPVNKISELQLAFDHGQIIQYAIERLREKIHFEPIGFNLLDETFTMSQLHNIYLAILEPPADAPIRDRRNFPRKMLKLGYIKPTEQKMKGTPYKQPKLFSFVPEAYQAAKKIGMRLEF